MWSPSFVAAVLIAAVSMPLESQSSADVSGRWTADMNGRSHSVNLQLERGDRRHRWNTGFDVKLDELNGLSDATVSGGGDARFTLEREAGTFSFGGDFSRGEGGGVFRFVPSDAFRASMRGLGYPSLSDDTTYMLAAENLTTDDVRHLNRIGYREISLRDLVRSITHGADVGYIEEMRSAGYRGLPLDEMIRMRDHGVDADFVADLRDHDIKDLPADDLVRARDHGVSGNFAAGVRHAGYRDASLDDVIRLRDHGVTVGFIQRVRGERGRDVSLDAIIRLRDRGDD